MSEEEFLIIKEKYCSLREIERIIIIDKLAEKTNENGNYLFTKVSGDSYAKPFLYRGGMGRTDYGKKHLEDKYDLSNWKYIETCYKGEYVFISLQSFDIDPETHNVHVLYDRLGLLIGYPHVDEMLICGTKVSSVLAQMQITKWQLPLSDTEVDELIQYIMELVEKFREAC